MQGALLPPPDWKRNVFADPSRQARLEKFHFHWVPHALSVDQKTKRVLYSKLLLMALMEQKAGGLQRIITKDERWFLLYYPPDSIWVASRDELPQWIKQKIDT
jgi:hypothetical protein